MRIQFCEGSNTGLQRTILTGIVSKNVRLDVLFEGDDTWYDIEMQTGRDRKALAYNITKKI